MVKHRATVIQKVVRRVNPGQIPIITADQPVYALLIQIQWQYSSDFGEVILKRPSRFRFDIVKT